MLPTTIYIMKIITKANAIKISKELKSEGKSIVLVGGFFDILHFGHIKFLEKAKKHGDFLFVLLESDKTARKIKGENRPMNTQVLRAQVLSALKFVDYIVLLPEMKNDADYDRLVTRLRPMVIAVTQNDKNIRHKTRQANLIGAKVIPVLSQISNKSTSRLVRIIQKNNL